MDKPQMKVGDVIILNHPKCFDLIHQYSGPGHPMAVVSRVFEDGNIQVVLDPDDPYVDDAYWDEGWHIKHPCGGGGRVLPGNPYTMQALHVLCERSGYYARKERERGKKRRRRR